MEIVISFQVPKSGSMTTVYEPYLYHIIKRKMRDTRPNSADDLKAAIKADLGLDLSSVQKLMYHSNMRLNLHDILVVWFVPVHKRQAECFCACPVAAADHQVMRLLHVSKNTCFIWRLWLWFFSYIQSLKRKTDPVPYCHDMAEEDKTNRVAFRLEHATVSLSFVIVITRLCRTLKTPQMSVKNYFAREYVKHRDDGTESDRHEWSGVTESGFIKGEKKGLLLKPVCSHIHLFY